MLFAPVAEDKVSPTTTIMSDIKAVELYVLKFIYMSLYEFKLIMSLSAYNGLIL